jgi:hypothetical protein
MRIQMINLFTQVKYFFPKGQALEVKVIFGGGGVEILSLHVNISLRRSPVQSSFKIQGSRLISPSASHSHVLVWYFSRFEHFLRSSAFASELVFRKMSMSSHLSTSDTSLIYCFCKLLVAWVGNTASESIR